MSAVESFLAQGPRAVNVGVRGFAESLAAQDVPVVHVDWTPPPQLEPDIAKLLGALR